MTFFACMLAMSETGVPVRLVVLAMVLDTILVCTGLATGFIHR